MMAKKYIIIIAAIGVFTGITAFVFSQNGPASAAGQKTFSSNNIIEYLEFREVDIKDVLRQLSKQYKLNIVFSESVSGLITVQLNNVTIEEALDAIITINGFVYTKKGDVIKVSTPEESEKEGKQTRVFKLNNADASKLKDTLSKILSSDGKIEADARSNAVIVTDNVTVISKINEMIPQLDQTTLQVLIESRFIETTLGASEKLGIDWTTTISASGSQRPTTFPFRKWGSEKDMYPIPEYSVDVTTENNTTSVTIDSAFPYDLKGMAQTLTSVGTMLTPALQLGAFPYTAASYFNFGTLDFRQLQAILGFLQTRSDTKLLSSPRIVTTDNKEAKISVGQTMRVLTSQTYDEETKQARYAYETVDVGVILTVTPQVSPDNHIKLKLKPEVSLLVGYTPGTTLPIIGKRTAETEVVVKDGQTIVIGGLVKTEKTHQVKKVPILGDLPLIGRIFRHNSEDPDSKTELMIFVTARILKDEEEGGILAMESGLKTSPMRPLKLDLREVRVK